MKKIVSLFLALTIMLSLCACGGNFGSVNLNDTMAIPADGVIKESIIKQIKNENAIGVFTGESAGMKYEWTIFGTDIEEPKTVNLGVRIMKNAEGASEIALASGEPFGFSALLSVYMDETWKAQSATGYVGDQAVVSVSLTGSKATILNLMLDGSVGAFVIRPDALLEDAIIDGEEETEAEEKMDDYLSDSKESNSAVSNNTTTSSNGTSKPDTTDNSYLSNSKDTSNQVYTDGKDKYLTDPVPEGKPTPVEPEDTEVNKAKSYTCTFSIECSTILNNLDMLDPEKIEMVPSNGVILAKTTVTFYEGESVFDVLQRICKEKGIHMEAEWTPIYNSAYVEGIHNLYEFDCGALSGWMYKVNGWYPNYGSSRYQLKDGDVVEWRYTCDLGNDVGGGYAVGG